MKTYRQLREKWIKTVPSYFKRGHNTDVFFNPNYKEILQISKEGYEGFRAFLLNGGDMYAWGDATHFDIKKEILKTNKRNIIPIRCEVNGKTAGVKISPDIDETNFASYSLDKVAGIIKEHRQMKRHFSNIIVFTRYTYG